MEQYHDSKINFWHDPFSLVGQLRLLRSVKIILLVNMILGFIILSYYKAQMNAALNVDNSEVPFQTWEYIANSDKKLLIWNGSLKYDWFRETKDPQLVAFNNLGFNGTVPLILDGDFLVLSISGPYFQMEEYPCQLIPLTHKELRYLIIET